MSLTDRLPAADIRAEVATRYGRVASDPTASTGFPHGREFAEAVGYTADALDRFPPEASASFAGVACLSGYLRIAPGATVVDLGCGAGLDSLLAAQQVGDAGHVIGVDLSDDMVQLARANAAAVGAAQVQIVCSAAEQAPLPDAVADVVMANGIINLSPEKPRLLQEIARLLAPDGYFLGAEIVLTEDIPAEERATIDDWFR